MAVFNWECYCLTAVVICLVLFSSYATSQQVSFKTLIDNGNATVVVGQVVQLLCTPEGIDLRVSRLEILFQDETIAIFENDNVISTDEHYAAMKFNSAEDNVVIMLSINGITKMDHGQYQCVAITSGLVYKSETIDLNVLQFPEVACSAAESRQAMFANGVLTTNKDIATSFTCLANSDDEHVPVILTWSRSDGKALSQDGYLVQSKVSLEPSIEEDNIVFTCAASNSRYDGFVDTCSVTVVIQEGFKNMNYTEPAGEPGDSSVGLVSAGAATAVVLLIVLIIGASICLYRIAKKESNESSRELPLSNTQMETRYVDNNNIDERAEVSTYENAEVAPPPRPPKRPPKPGALQNNALVDQLNQTFATSADAETSNSNNSNTNISLNDASGDMSNEADSSRVYSEVPVGNDPDSRIYSEPPSEIAKDTSFNALLSSAISKAVNNSKDNKSGEVSCAPVDIGNKGRRSPPPLPVKTSTPKNISRSGAHRDSTTKLVMHIAEDSTPFYVEETKV